MTNIEAYLSGAVEYDALTDAERCAICAAMEGCLVWDDTTPRSAQHFSRLDVMIYPNHCCKRVGGQGIVWNEYYTMTFGEYYYRQPDKSTFIDHYLSDGTAALRLVERFGIDLIFYGTEWRTTAPVGNDSYDCVDERGDIPSAAIVSAVCALARAQYPYKVGA